MAERSPPPPPLMESMETDLLERTVSALFPQNQVEAPTTAHTMPNSDYPTPVTMEELNGAVKRMAAKNTTPGADGIPGKALSLALTVLHEELVETMSNCLREGKMPVGRRPS